MTKQKIDPVECPACHSLVTTTQNRRLRRHAIGPYRDRGERPQSLEPTGGSDARHGSGLPLPVAAQLVRDKPILERTREQLRRQQEIARYAHIRCVVWDELDPGVIVFIDEQDAKRFGCWVALSVGRDGRVASYEVNLPPVYDTFETLIGYHRPPQL